MAGRFVGTWLMGRIDPDRLLAMFSIAAAGLTAAAVLLDGVAGVLALAAANSFMSIMFPTIFASSIRGLGPLVKPGASLLIMAIIGGAVMAPVMGWLADVAHSMQFAMMAPALCFVVVLGFALSGRRAPAAERQAAQA
jgi:FHS family L-fucose permease-like MFS transporter